MNDEIKNVDNSKMVKIEVIGETADDAADPGRIPEILYKKADNLDTNSTDVLTNFASTIVSAAPIIGPPIGEAIKTAIPNQRVDRVVLFVRQVESRVTDLEKTVVQIQTPEGLDLLEDVVLQATRAMTDERREYLANIFINGISNEDLNHVEKKKLILMLEDLYDAEIVHLRHYYLMRHGEEEEEKKFRNAHMEVVKPANHTFGATPEEENFSTFRESYISKLMSLDLISLSNSGKYKQITPLGAKLVEYIQDDI